MAPQRNPRSRKLRIATTLCAAVVVGAGAGAGLTGWTAPAPAAQEAARDVRAVAAAPSDVRAVAAAPSPSPDPFEDLTADEIADRAVTATQSATSLRMSGRIVSDGQPLDIDFSVNDKNQCTGRVKVEGGTAELRQADKITYMKGDEKFWRASMTSQGMPEAQIDATIELLKGRWLKITPGQEGSEDLSGVCDLTSLLAELDKDPEERRGLTRGPDAEVEETPVATLVKKKTDGGTTPDTTPDTTTPDTTTVSVSQKGKPYILKIVKTGGEEPGTMLLSDYDKPVKVVVPPADETVDISKLEQATPV
ncbi:hypothetical protein [Streptomyces vilmorinianum]|uniref:hypothetical protein n=1 Tax=Streptomyces vilmorinianum TaxID=3051092 RepID=UPI0010FB664A|nr:hypothetical protein [Streptomyces vilmorinianum]